MVLKLEDRKKPGSRERNLITNGLSQLAATAALFQRRGESKSGRKD
jgi:hypothetical protein